MGEIRGEKIRFRKEDFIPLHELPSAGVEDPIIVHCPPRSTVLGGVGRWSFGALASFVLIAGGIFALIESGGLDSVLSDVARSALNSAVAPAYHAEIGGTAIRFAEGFQLAIEARNVSLVGESHSSPIAQTQSVRLILDPVALLGGHVRVKEIESEGVALDARLLPESEPLDMSKLRIDAIPALLENAFLQLDMVQSFIAKGGLDRMRVGGLQISATSVSGRPMTISVDDLAMERGQDNSLSIYGAISINGQQTELTALTVNNGGRAQSLTLRIADLRLTPFMLRRDNTGSPRQGLDGSSEIIIAAKRAGEGQAPAMSLTLNSQAGTFYFDGNPQELTRAQLSFGYDFAKDTLEISPTSRMQFGPMVLPLSGGLIDLDRLPGNTVAGSGFGIDLLVSEGLAAVPASGDAPFPFSLKVFGRYVNEAKELQLDTLSVSSPSGTMDGNLRIRFGGTGPEIQFDALVNNMKSSVIKQLWPYWMADKPRKWVLANIFGGTVTKGQISVFIPQNRLSVEPKPLHLDANELNINFDIVDTRMNVTGEIPPLRDMDAHFDMSGGKVSVDIKNATSYFPSGRMVKIDSGRVGLENVYVKPLMADIDIAVSGAADGVAELVSFKPMRALQRVGFAPEDFSGTVRGTAQVRLGLIADQNPPEPVWKANLQLQGVDVAKPFGDRQISDIDGTLDVDPRAARLKAKAGIDGVPMEIAMTEPVDSDSDVARERVVKATLDNAGRRKLVPGLDEIVDGPVVVQLTRIDEKRQAVSVDLKSANLMVPWIGWSKGQGINAKATFETTEADNGETDINKFVLDGDGFGAKGSLATGKDGLISADFARLQFTPGDDFALTLRSAKGAYDVNISGKSADFRSLLAKVKSDGPAGFGGAAGGGKAGGSGADSNLNLRLQAKLDRVVGFGDEAMSNVSLTYSSRAGKTTGLDVSAVTDTGQALVSKLRKPEGLSEISVTSSDAGALSRFINLYDHMVGGLLNLKLAEGANGLWNGSLDIRNFQVENEQRLQSIVSTPTGADGRSLNSAVKRDIDVSTAKFQRAFARLVYSDSTLRIDNGIVRGEQVGATLQGTVRDADGRIDMTGTFMPAYGLNRLFAELPVIGILLGNGRDRGLLGITFKLSGATEQPKLTINPLSIIAPGVFRQIFEFR
ncbi:MAG: hypothetical protein DI528_11815 [Shinella sp.]|nr:MAG: hypothetical protein DI528_11815 [Shinella sp.]